MSTSFGPPNRIHGSVSAAAAAAGAAAAAAAGIGNPRSMAVPLSQQQKPMMMMGIPPKPGRVESNKEISQHNLPTLCQVIAMSMCYKRLAFVILFMPSICAILPPLCNVSYSVIQGMSGGFGAVCIVLTITFTVVWYAVLKNVAPSPEKLQEAYDKSRIWLPLGMFVLTSGFIRVICGIARSMKAEESPQPTSALPFVSTSAWGFGLKPAFGFLLMGFAVLLRFVGQGSYVRCSTVPLVSNDYVDLLNAKIDLLKAKISYFYSYFSPRKTIDPNAMTTASNPNAFFHSRSARLCGRRYQLPTLLSCLVNFNCTFFLGPIVAEIMLVPAWLSLHPDRLSHDEAELSRWVIYGACFVTMVVHLMVGNSHEINPKKYYTAMTGSYFPIDKAVILEGLRVARWCTLPTLLLSFACVVGRCLGFQEMLGKDTWQILSFCIASSAAVGFSMAVLEEASKAALCVRGMDLQRLVREVFVGAAREGQSAKIAMEDEDKHMLDVVLHSILHGDAALVGEVGRRTLHNEAHNKLQRIEADRNRSTVDAMWRVLLGVGDSFRALEAALEEDMLRHSLLESLGGSSYPDTTSTNSKKKQNISSSALVVSEIDGHFRMASSHIEAIAYWIEDPCAPRGPPTEWTGRTYSALVEAKGLPLIRALCAYTGGLGRALIECSNWGSPHSTWLIRPGALVAAEYSVIAMARCVEKIFFVANTRATDWKLSPISLLIPAILNSAYCLHDGIVQRARYLDRIKHPHHWEQTQEVETFGHSHNKLVQGTSLQANTNAPQKADAEIMKEHPDLNHLLVAIQHAAKVIMREVKLATSSGLGATTLRNDLDDDCEQWLQCISSGQTTG